MKKLIYLIIALGFGFQSFAQIPNNGFENWTNMGSYSVPDGWGNMNGYTSSAGVFTCIKSTPGNPGSSYMRLITKQVPGMGLVPGIASTGAFDPVALKPLSGFPFTSRPEYLEGNWQFMAFGDDQGYISILLTRWNSQLQSRDSVSYTYFRLPGMIMSWRNFAIPLTYNNGMMPDTAIIVASASSAEGSPIAEASYLYLDNLEFTGTVAGVKNITSQMFRIYPVPADDFININLKTQEKVTVRIFDLSGKEVYKTVKGGSFAIDIKSFNPGTYIISVKGENKSQTARFVKVSR